MPSALSLPWVLMPSIPEMLLWFSRRLSMRPISRTEAAKAAVYALSFAQDSGAHLYFCYVFGLQVPTSWRREVLDGAFQSALKRMIPELLTTGAIPNAWLNTATLPRLSWN